MLKKTVIIILLFSFSILFSLEWGKIKYTHGNVNIRKSRSIESEKIGKLKPNEKVKVDFLEDNWYAIFDFDVEERNIKFAKGFVYAPLLFDSKKQKKKAYYDSEKSYYSLSLYEKKKIFYDTVYYEDLAGWDDAKNETYKYRLCSQYNISRSTLDKIALDGVLKNWPMP
jgi:hypothetical protein